MSRAMIGERRARSLLRTYAWLIVAITVVTILTATTVAALRPATYTSFSEVVVNPAKSPIGTTVTQQPPNMGTEQQIVLSGEVARGAARRLGPIPPAVAKEGLSVSVPIDATTLTISYTAESAKEAFARAKAFTQAYIIFHNETQQDTVAAVITDPTLPAEPNGTNYALVIGLSLILGAMIGVGTAFVWDKTTDRLRDVEDTEANTGLPVLAAVPELKSTRRMAVAGSPTPGSEALGYLSVQLTHAMTARKATSALVTSPSPGAGKTTMAVSIATSLAKVGKNVVLVDVLNGSSPLHDALRANELPGLHVVTGDPDAVHGSLSVNLEDMAELLGRLTKTADVVVIDAPTVLGKPDTPLLAEHVDAVLLVVDLRSGLRADANAAMAALSHVEHKLVGCVTNRPRPRRHGLLSGRRRNSTDGQRPSEVPVDRQVQAPVAEVPPEPRLAQAISEQPPTDAGLEILRSSNSHNGDGDETHQLDREETQEFDQEEPSVEAAGNEGGDEGAD
jgi:Mrp family chromosome partitioning ATPase